MFSFGSAADPIGKFGLTELSARLMAEGGAGKSSYEEIVKKLFPYAAKVEWQIDREQIAFVLRLPSEGVGVGYAILLDLLKSPQFQTNDFERVKMQMLSNLQSELKGSDEESLGKELLQAFLYEKHPYGHPSVGHVKDLKNITIDDVKAHYSRWFCSNNLTVGLTGSIPSTLLRHVREDFTSWNTKSCQGLGQRPLQRNSGRRIILVEKPDAKAIAVSMGFTLPITRAHPDFASLKLASSYLGEHRQFVGSLMQAVREKRGLNYGDYAYAEHFEQQSWTRFAKSHLGRHQQYFSVWLRPLDPKRAVFAVRLAVRELERLTSQGLNEQEVQRMKHFLVNYYALFSQSASEKLAQALDAKFYAMEENIYSSLIRQWKALGKQEINKNIKKYFDLKNLQIVMIVPKAAPVIQELLAASQQSPSYPGAQPKSLLQEDVAIRNFSLNISKEDIRVLGLDAVF
ncbi:MAG: insulinase family protein [Myxococcales bacterium]|nr:MAG: insulinase family protein [Myxococcales bacterium]